VNPTPNTVPEPQASSNRRLKSLAGYAFGLLIVVCLFAAFRSSAGRLHGAYLSITPSSALIGLAAGLLASALSAWSWGATLRTLGCKASGREMSRVWYRSMVARYVPGTVPGIAYRIALTTEIGVSRTIAAAATVVDWVCWLLSALFACLVTAPWWSVNAANLAHGALPGSRWIGLAVALPVGLIMLHPRVIGWLIAKASSKAGAELPPEMSYRQTLRLIPIYLVKWPLYGLSIAVFLPGSAAGWVGHLPAATGAFSLGWVGGFLSPISPGGLGVREGIIVGVLHGAAAAQALLAAALLSRLVTTAAEVLCWIGTVKKGAGLGARGARHEAWTEDVGRMKDEG